MYGGRRFWLAMRNAPSRRAGTYLAGRVALARDDASPLLRFGDAVRRYQSQLWWISGRTARNDGGWPARQTPLAHLPAGTVQLVHGGELRRPRGGEESVSIRFKAPGRVLYCRVTVDVKLKKSGGSGDPATATNFHAAVVLRRNADCGCGCFVTRIEGSRR